MKKSLSRESSNKTSTYKKDRSASYVSRRQARAEKTVAKK